MSATVRLHRIGAWSHGNGEVGGADPQDLSSAHSLLVPKITSYNVLWRHLELQSSGLPCIRPPSSTWSPRYLTWHVRRGISDVAGISAPPISGSLEVPEDLPFFYSMVHLDMLYLRVSWMG